MRRLLLVLLFCLVVLSPAAPARAVEVDLELVLAADVSGSIDGEEFAAQRAGYASALRHPDFLRAVRRGARGRVAVSYFEWAAGVRPLSRAGWHLVEDEASAEALAARIETLPASPGRGTALGEAIRAAAAMLDGNGFEGDRRVIDVSGDGPNNVGPPVAAERDRAVRAGVTVNGLAVLIRPSPAVAALDRYFADCVSGGPGAFVLPVRGRADLATAIRRKLVLEVSGAPETRVLPAAVQDAADCLAGERFRERWADPHFPELGP